MPRFLNADDFKSAIRQEVLAAVIRQDDTTREQAEDRAIEMVKSYLEPRFNSAAIYAKQGTARSQLIVYYTVDITIYILMRSVGKLNQQMMDNYEDAIDWLEKLAKGTVSPTGLDTYSSDTNGDGVPDTITTTMKWGSNQSQSNIW